MDEVEVGEAVARGMRLGSSSSIKRYLTKRLIFSWELRGIDEWRGKRDSEFL